MSADTSLTDRDPEAKRSLVDSVKGVSRTLVLCAIVAAALLSFPSVLPWMIAFWLVWHTILAKLNRPAWLPIATCLVILVVKLVPRTPGMIALGLVLLIVVVVRFRQRQNLEARSKTWWPGALVLWIVWGFMFYEWRTIETCNRTVALDLSRPVVCIGDSLTQGMLPDHGYPEQLKAMVKLPVINLGFSGISTSQGLGQLSRVLEHNPQVVVIELGGHDFLKGNSRAETKENLEQMIDGCRAGGAEVILMEIPRGFMLDPFASLEREIAYQRDVQLISDSWLRKVVVMSPIAPPGMWMPDAQLSDDGIHSNPRGSKAIARYVAEALRRMYGEEVLDQAHRVIGA